MALVERRLDEIKWTKEDIGTIVEGVLVRLETVNYSDGPGLRYLVKGDRSGEMISFPGTAGLNRRLYAGDIGRRVSITFIGLEDAARVSPGLSPQKLFKVLVEDAPLEGSKLIASVRGGDPGITDADIPF